MRKFYNYFKYPLFLITVTTALMLQLHIVHGKHLEIQNKTSTTANIDLVIEDIRFEPQVLRFDEFYVGKVFGLSFTIRDLFSTSSIDSNQFHNAVYLSTDSVLDPTDYLLGEVNKNNLAIYLPFTTKTGVYRFFFVADSRNVVEETNEGNNVAFKDIKVHGLSIDYSINGLTASYDRNDVADSLNVSYYLTRKQFSYMSGPYTSYAGIYLSEDTILDRTSDLLLKYDSIPYNYYDGGNKYESRNFTTKVPAAVKTGDYYVLGVIGIDNPVAEINDQNNFTWTKIAIPDTSEFIIEKIDLVYDTVVYHPESGNYEGFQGKMVIAYNCSICGGPKATTELYISKDSILDDTDLSNGLGTIGGFLNSRNEIHFNISKLSKEYSGKTYLIGKINPYSFNPGIGMHSQVFVKPLYIRNYDVDLYPESIDIDVSKYATNQTITVQYGIYNGGKDLARGFSIEQVVLSTDSLISPDDSIRFNYIQTNIGREAFDPLYPVMKGKFPNLIPGQTYYFIFFFNNPDAFQGHTEESNYTNNKVAVPFTIDPITSTNSPVENFDVQLFPNPSSDLLNITIDPSIQGETEVVLMNGFGQPVLAQRFNDATLLNIHTKGLPAGVYAVKVQTSKGRGVDKVVVE